MIKVLFIDIKNKEILFNFYNLIGDLIYVFFYI